MAGNFSSGSFSGSIGGFSVDVVVTTSATPGINWNTLRAMQRGLRQEGKEEPAIAQQIPAIAQKPPRFDYDAQYNLKVAKVTAAIRRLTSEAEAALARIAELEAMESERLADAQLAHELLLAQQAHLLAETQRAVFVEEMEVIDVAYFALMAVCMSGCKPIGPDAQNLPQEAIN